MPRRCRSASLWVAGAALGCAAIVGFAVPAVATTGATVTTDDGAGNPLFVGGADVMPGDSSANCIAVNYSAPTPATLTMNGSASGSAASDLDLTVDAGSGGVFGDCTGFSGSNIYSGTLASFAAAYGTGMPGLVLASGATSGAVSLRITVGLSLASTAQGLNATASFSWSVVAPDAAGTPVATSVPVASPSPSPSPSPSSSPSPSPSSSPSPTGSAPPSGSTSVPIVTRDPGTGVVGVDVVPSSPPDSAVASAPAGSPLASAPPSSAAAGPGSAGGPSSRPGHGGAGGKAGGGQPGSSGTSQQGSPVTRFFGSVAAITRQAVPAVAKGSGLPLTLLVPILLFVVVQHLIDRRDPKLALAPTYPEPTLPFDPDPASPPR